MASLRARLLAGVLTLAAAGLIALAAVTYAEQHSFLESRVNQEVKAAGPAIAQLLDNKGFVPPGQQDSEEPAGGDPDRAKDGAGGGRPSLNLPPGTFGQRRDASGRVLGEAPVRYSASESSAPKPEIPAEVQVGKLFTVGSEGSSGLRYRVYATRDMQDSGLTLVAVPLHEVQATLDRLLLVEGLVIVGVLLALGLGALFLLRVGLRPLDRIEATAGQIAAGDLSRRVSPATQRTEVGRLGLALNGMLERLEQAFAARTASEERLRQFLSDASHELRTPLASIRGYAELFRMGAAREEQDVALAMRRIEQESERMGVLVEDLLVLARLDETPERERVAVDMAALAGDAVADARATAPERDIAFEAPERVVVQGDALQLRQVLANLLRNALQHTPAGTSIEVALALQGEEAVTVSVRDHGPGIPAQARERLFERFWRQEAGRTRGRAGAGLGLAIVQGVVSAHGGTVQAQDAPGGGALFVVELPRS